MISHFIHLYLNSADITNTARGAGIPYRTFATAALMDRYAGEEQKSDGEPLCLLDIIWKTRLALGGVEPCAHEINDQFEVYLVELFSLVKGKPSPELVQVHAILDRKAEGGARLLLKLQDEA
jgi:inactivated superfamily I helicase